MNLRVLLFLLSLAYHLSAQNWQSYSPPVLINGDTLKLAWAGGLNNPVISNIDLNFDGQQDILIYEKAGKILMPFLQIGNTGNPQWQYAPIYASAFPQENATWMLLQDFNCDNKPDLFYGNSTGRIKCYQNTSGIIGPLQFTLYANSIKTKYPFFTDLSYTITDLPALIDIDEDGDMDILTFAGISTTVEWHRNYAKENYNRCDTFDFTMETDCWGYFAENQFNNNVTLNISCKGNTGGQKTLHSGSTLLALDLDANGSKELMIGDISYNTLVQLTNGGTPQNAQMSAKDTTFPSYNIPVDMQVFPAAYYADVTADGNRDLIVSPFPENASWNVGNILFYENTNTDAQPIFNFKTDSLFNQEMIDLGSDANVAVFDENGDGLMDVLIGNYVSKAKGRADRSELTLFRNVGTATNPVFTLIDRNYLSISTLLGNTVLGLFPTTGDLDNDGDIDLLIGDMDGKIHIFQNSAGVGNPASFSLFAQNYNGIDVGAFASPQLVDLDEDGKLDLICGKENGTISFFKNTGGPQGFSFASVADDPFWGQVDVLIPCCTGYATPHVFKIPGDTLWQLWVGSEQGYIYQYSGINTQSGSSFTLIDSILPGVEKRGRIRVFLQDINQDGKPELFTGNNPGGVLLYSMNPASSNNAIAPNQTFSIYPNPTKDILNWQSRINVIPQEIHLLDLNGKILKKIYPQNGQGEIQVNELPIGNYFLKFIYGNKQEVIPFLRGE